MKLSQAVQELETQNKILAKALIEAQQKLRQKDKEVEILSALNFGLRKRLASLDRENENLLKIAKKKDSDHKSVKGINVDLRGSLRQMRSELRKTPAPNVTNNFNLIMAPNHVVVSPTEPTPKNTQKEPKALPCIHTPPCSYGSKHWILELKFA